MEFEPSHGPKSLEEVYDGEIVHSKIDSLGKVKSIKQIFTTSKEFKRPS